jgi:arginyl-tRNA synthetase
VAVVQELRRRLADALERQLGVTIEEPTIRRSTRADFQWNDPLALAKRLDRPARAIAEAVLEAAAVGDLVDCEVADAGFVNITVHDDVLGRDVRAVIDDAALGFEPVSPRRFVIDYSAPNIAKELHVGHLRSSVIGDALARLLRFAGHEVIPQNHVGDWGTQFGILLAYLLRSGYDLDAIRALDVATLTSLYRDAQRSFESDPDFAQAARTRVVLLQAGDPESTALWQAIVETSEREFLELYRDLDIDLGPESIRGESSYNDALEPVLEELTAAGLVVESDGALCVFPEGFSTREGNPLPLIIRKADGGFGYAATDLAAVRYRMFQLEADTVLYVVDMRQSQHFAMVFAVARAAGWLERGTAEHVGFGTILGPDGKPFRTREGELVSLRQLIDEAIRRAAELGAARTDGERREVDPAVARAIGVGALKYADLSNDRAKDYVFDFDRMISLVGNTAPYLQYSYARLMSIRGRAGDEWAAASTATLVLAEPVERELALLLPAFGEIVASAILHRQPHRLCTYLYDLTSTFGRFYEQCPVLRAQTDELKHSRLLLCSVSAAILRQGLDLLGIAAVEHI